MLPGLARIGFLNVVRLPEPAAVVEGAVGGALADAPELTEGIAPADIAFQKAVVVPGCHIARSSS